MRHGRFEENLIEDNGRYGHLDRAQRYGNEFFNNTVARNGSSGVYFRKETLKNSDNLAASAYTACLPRPDAYGLISAGNHRAIHKIRDTRVVGATQKVSIYKASGVGSVLSRDNNLGTGSEQSAAAR